MKKFLKRLAFALILIILCRGLVKKPQPESATDSVAIRAAKVRDSTRAAVKAAALPRKNLTVDSLPLGAFIALKLDVRPFVPYRANEYDPLLRASYRFTADDAMFMMRADLQGRGRNDFVFAGRNAGNRSVMAVMQRQNRGWTVQNVSEGEVGTRAPLDSASQWVTRGEREHPNGKWDAVVVTRLYGPMAPRREVYYWDAVRGVFLAKDDGR